MGSPEGFGERVVVCLIGLDSADASDTRVAMRLLRGGHDVPPDELRARFPRTLASLERAIAAPPHGLVFDDADLAHPFRRVAAFRDGALVGRRDPPPWWMTSP